MKDLVNSMIVLNVKEALSKFEQFDKGYLASSAFKFHVLFRANDLKMTVNEIIYDFKKINGIME